MFDIGKIHNFRKLFEQSKWFDLIKEGRLTEKQTFGLKLKREKEKKIMKNNINFVGCTWKMTFMNVNDTFFSLLKNTKSVEVTQV